MTAAPCNILITGAKGFVGRNFKETLLNIKEGKDKSRPQLQIGNIYEIDIDSSVDELTLACREADFVFNLAGVNRPEDPRDFMKGNKDFAQNLLELLEQNGNTCPVVLSSSIQASLEGRFKDSPYGISKKAAEDLFFEYGRRTGAEVSVLRLPNLFGKWCRPNYNSAIATFCHNIAHDLPIQVNDPNTELTLVYIDDLIQAFLDLILGIRNTVDGFDHVSPQYTVPLGEIVEWLRIFYRQPQTLVMPSIPKDSFQKKLYSTFLSYLPPEKAAFSLKMNKDHRGSFTELLKTLDHGQFSVNVTKPGLTKGEHWHHSKWEFFIVVSGQGRIRMRKVDSDTIYDFDVDGENIQAVHMLPGYTHNIINLSKDRDLVTVMWANEAFDPQRPDTFFLKVDQNT